MMRQKVVKTFWFLLFMIFMLTGCLTDRSNESVDKNEVDPEHFNEVENNNIEETKPVLSESGGWPVVEGIYLEDEGSNVTLTNTQVSFTLTKSSATINSLKKKGKYEEENLLAKGGRGYHLLNYVLDGSKHEVGLSSMDYELVSYSNTRVHISLTLDNEIKLPFVVEYHFVMEADSPGLYTYSIFRYPEDMPDKLEIEQSRYSVRANPDIFTHYGIEDGMVGDRLGSFPTPDDMRAGETLMDATTRLPNDEVYTKYNHSVYVGDNRVNGIFGDDLGISIIRPNSEYLVGGPWKQEYFVEQTAKTPLVHFYEQVRHFGVPNVVPEKGWEKIYGPFLIYVNEEEGLENLWENAIKKADEEVEKWPYQWLDDPLYAVEGRGEVQGKLTITDGTSPDNAWVILGASEIPVYEQNLDYLYFVKTDHEGNFYIPAVRPGNYSLYATVDGVFGEYEKTGVIVSSNDTTDLQEISWEPKKHGKTIWTIGTPNRTPREFKYGDDLRQWGLWLQYPLDFPEDVDFVIGESDEQKDWNYAQPNIKTPGKESHLLVPFNKTPTEWKIYFDMDEEITGEGMLTIAIAASSDGSLKVVLNDAEIYKDKQVSPLKNDAAYYRSGVSGYYNVLEIPFSASLFEKGENIVTLQHLSGEGGSTVGIMYDALRMEIAE